MSTTDLKAQAANIKAKIAAKLLEIAQDDEELKKLYAELDAVNEQLIPSEVNDQIVIDRTNRRTDASQGTSAR